MDASQLSALASLMAPAAPKADSRKSLKRKTTPEGKSYEWYTTIGGTGKGALPLPERTKMVHLLDKSTTVLKLNSYDDWFSGFDNPASSS